MAADADGDREERAWQAPVGDEAIVGVCQHDLRGRILSVNRFFAETFGNPALRAGQLIADVLEPEAFAQFCAYMERVQRRGSERALLDWSGHEGRRWYFSGRFVARAGHTPYIVSCATDVGELVATDTSAARAQENYRRLLELSPDALLVHDGERVLFVSKAALMLFRATSRDLLVGHAVADYIHPDYRAVAEQRLREVLANGTTSPVMEQVWFRLDGTSMEVEVTGAPMIENGLVRVHVVLRDITDKKRERAALQKSQALLRQVVAAAPIVLWAADKDGIMTLQEGRGLRDFGAEPGQFVGASVLELYGQQPFTEETGENLGCETAFRRALAGEQMVGTSTAYGIDTENVLGPLYNDAGELDGMVGASLIVTEQRRLREQLHQSQKMELVGQLAGAVAHDFNNLLTVIVGSAQLLGESAAPSQRADVKEICDACEKATRLTKQLLALSRKQVIQQVVLDLNERLEHAGQLLGRLIGEHIRIQHDLVPDLGRIRADVGHVEQVLMNLVVNARDAMPHGGTLKIATRNLDLGAPNSSTPGLGSGQYVMLTVEDTGGGIAPENLQRIFEPFFTTKDVGKGTGLGLATVRRIVLQSGGAVWAESARGQGARFVVCFPRIDAERTPTIPALSRPQLQGEETILVIEDEPEVLRVTARVLNHFGYEVLMAGSGAEAIAIARTHPGVIDLVITDIVMPEMNGVEAAERVQEYRPNTPVLFVSGYTDNELNAQRITDSGAVFLRKPYNPEELAARVRELLVEPALRPSPPQRAR